MSGNTLGSALVLATTMLLCAVGAGVATAQPQFEFGTTVTVVNMIPFDRSGEENQDSEPNLAVNPANPLHIVGSAFTPNPMDDVTATVLASFAAKAAVGELDLDDGLPPPQPGVEINAPIYVSTDGGMTWSLRAIVPGGNAVTGTLDITVRFGGESDVLYAALLRGDRTFGFPVCPTPPSEPEDVVFVPPGGADCVYLFGPLLNVDRTEDIESADLMDIIWHREFVDQPYVQAETARGGAGRRDDRVFVGNNDLNFSVFYFPGQLDASGRTATVDHSSDAATADFPAGFKQTIIESQATAGQNGPAVRVAVHRDGTVYGVFYRWTSVNGDFDPKANIIANVMVVRDDSFGTGSSPFTDLVNPADGTPGRPVVQIRKVPWSAAALPEFGQERLVGSDLTIAVDPRDSDTVYVAWADSPLGSKELNYILHLRRSTDRGATWSPSDLLTVSNAKNPALAVNSRGKVGFLYQAVADADDGQRWVTHFRRSTNGLTWGDMILADVPADSPGALFRPYIGDYVHVMAVGNDFYGVFSANNTPNPAQFPQGVVYQRLANFNTHTLSSGLNGHEVAVSIDPFFFKVDEFDFPEVLAPAQ